MTKMEVYAAYSHIRKSSDKKIIRETTCIISLGTPGAASNLLKQFPTRGEKKEVKESSAPSSGKVKDERK